VRGTSEETVVTKRQELAVASAALVASREDIARLRAELKRSALNAET
jgi:HlyD family secretion protein